MIDLLPDPLPPLMGAKSGGSYRPIFWKLRPPGRFRQVRETACSAPDTYLPRLQRWRRGAKLGDHGFKLGEHGFKLGDRPFKLGDLGAKLGDLGFKLGDRGAELGDLGAKLRDPDAKLGDRGFKLGDRHLAPDEVMEPMALCPRTVWQRRVSR